MRDEDVQRVVTAELTRAADAVEVAPLAGRAVRVLMAGGHHAELFNAIVSGADRYLADHHTELRELFEAESPRWVPDAVYQRVFDRLYSRLRDRLAAMAADPDDEARHQFEEWLAGLPDRLETSPELRERGELHQARCPGQRRAAGLVLVAVEEAKDTLRTQAADPGSELRRRLAGALAAAGGRLGSDRRLQDSVERVVESGARALADQFHDELRWPGHGNHPAVGRRTDVEPAGAATRTRPAVHPHQWHSGGSWRGPGLARHRPGPGLIHAHLEAGPVLPGSTCFPARQARLLPSPDGARTRR